MAKILSTLSLKISLVTVCPCEKCFTFCEKREMPFNLFPVKRDQDTSFTLTPSNIAINPTRVGYLVYRQSHTVSSHFGSRLKSKEPEKQGKKSQNSDKHQNTLFEMGRGLEQWF